MVKSGVTNIPALLSLFFILVMVLGSGESLAKSIRTVQVDDGQVIAVKTALGYSTILEFTSKPISAVLGDQDAFKLEYVGSSITIKPLAPRASSNLFIFTEYERFNCALSTVLPAHVDYIVRIKTKLKSYPVEMAQAPPSLKSSATATLVTRQIRRSSSYNGLTLTVISVSRDSSELGNPRSVTLIDFELSSKRRAAPFQASSVGVKQLGRYLNVESLYLSGVALSPGASPIRGKLALLSQDFKPRLPLQIVFAVPETSGRIHRIEVSTGKPNQGRKKTREYR